MEAKRKEEASIDPGDTAKAMVALASAMLAEQRAANEAQKVANEVVSRLEKTVGRFVVALERQLGSSEAAKKTAAKHLEGLPPANDKIREEVRRKLRLQQEKKNK